MDVKGYACKLKANNDFTIPAQTQFTALIIQPPCGMFEATLFSR
jgi:hypothetical protein